MQRAAEKLKLEALVIAKGKFKMPASAANLVTTKKETMAELTASLLRLDTEKIVVVPDTKEGKKSVLSDEDLEMLLDRSPKVFSERGEGWISSRADAERCDMTGNELDKDGQQHTASGTRSDKKAAFAVYQAPVDEGNDVLSKMLGEDT